MDKVIIENKRQGKNVYEISDKLAILNIDSKKYGKQKYNQQVEQAELLVMDNDRLQQEVENLKDTIYYDVEKYRQALQEIRDIFSHLDENNWFHTGKHIYMDDRCINEIKTRIIAKINEVIGAE